MNRNIKSPGANNSQAGMSVISLMMGIALSSITMLTATHMHTTQQLAASGLQDTIRHNRTVLTSLKIIEKEIRSAGYGIPDADGNHILIQYDAGDASTPATRSLLWRYIIDSDTDEDGDIETGGEPECRALIESGTFIGGIEHRALTLYRSSACHDFDPIQNTNWNKTIGRLGLWEVKDEVETHLSANNTLFSFTLETATCSFPGHGRPEEHLSVTINVPDQAELNGQGITDGNGITVCLTNMYPTS